MDFFPWKYYVYLITVQPSWNTPSTFFAKTDGK